VASGHPSEQQKGSAKLYQTFSSKQCNSTSQRDINIGKYQTSNNKDPLITAQHKSP